jgi:hypothetical protein
MTSNFQKVLEFNKAFGVKSNKTVQHEIFDNDPKLVQYIKFAESKTGIGSEIVRKPRLILEGSERQSIEKIIDDGIKNRPVLPDYLHL